VPPTFNDDYATRPAAEAAARVIGIGRPDGVQMAGDPPPGLDAQALKHWWYQRFMKEYLRCVAAIDDSVGRLLSKLDELGVADDTLVIYTSDQGYFLGDHGWADKRFMYEPSLRMPFILRYPAEIPAGTTRPEILTNLDFAPTLLDYAGIAAPSEMQGVSGRAMLRGSPPADWQQSFYYRYWDHGGRGVCAHYGVRTATHKLVYFHPSALTWTGKVDVPPCLTPYWELFDLETDPHELHNRHGDPALAGVQTSLRAELVRLQRKYGDQPLHQEG